MTGIYYQVHQQRPNPALLLPHRVGEHVWIAAAVFRVSAEALRGRAADTVHLDRENLATITVGCYVCEQPWSAQLSVRGCPGHPVVPMVPV
jgi:hypothetical protein